VKRELIGGCDIAMQMLQSGELQKLIDEAGAKNAA
jgi:glutaredoxin-related protein